MNNWLMPNDYWGELYEFVKVQYHYFSHETIQEEGEYVRMKEFERAIEFAYKKGLEDGKTKAWIE